MHRMRTTAALDTGNEGLGGPTWIARRRLGFRRFIALASAAAALLTVGIVGGTTGVASAAITTICPTTGSGAALACAQAYVPLASPVRVYDSRPLAVSGDTGVPGFGTTLTEGSSDVVNVTTATAATATAAVVNITATGATQGGWLTVYPNGQTAPGTANVNFTSGQTVGNEVTVGLDGSQNFKVEYANGTSTGSVDFTADVVGYYTTYAAGTNSSYVALTGSRIYDTRTNSGDVPVPLGAGSTLHAGTTDTIPVAGGSTPAPASGTTAVVLNVAITNPTAGSWITVYPSTDSTEPGTANQNFSAGETLSSQVIVGVGGSDAVKITNYAGSVDVIVDEVGYYTTDSGTGSLLTTLATPLRLLDTRSAGVNGGLSASASPTIDPSTAGQGADAYALSITDLASAYNWITAYPTGAAVPYVSNDNYTTGNAYDIVENAAYASASGNGSVSFYNGPANAANANVVVDEDAYFVPIAPTMQVFSVPASISAGTAGSSATFYVNTEDNGFVEGGDNLYYTVTGTGTTPCTVADFTEGSVSGPVPLSSPGSSPGYDIVFTPGTTGVSSGSCTLHVSDVPGGGSLTNTATVTLTT